MGVTGQGPFGVYGAGQNAKSGVGVIGEGYHSANGVIGLSFPADGRDQLSAAAGVIGAANADSTRNSDDQNAVAGAGVVGLSLTSIPVLFDTGLPPLPDPNAVPDGDGTGVWGASGGGAGVHGQSEQGTGGVFQSRSGTGASVTSLSGAQLRLVPSPTPLDRTPLMKTGQVGDLYLFSVSQEAGKAGTTLWLCVAPAGPGSDAAWAQLALGDTIGG